MSGRKWDGNRQVLGGQILAVSGYVVWSLCDRHKESSTHTLSHLFNTYLFTWLSHPSISLQPSILSPSNHSSILYPAIHSLTIHSCTHLSLQPRMHPSISCFPSFIHSSDHQSLVCPVSMYLSIINSLSINPCSQSILCISHKISLFSWCPGSFPRSYFYITYQNCATGDGTIRNKE